MPQAGFPRSGGVKQLAKLCESINSQHFANWIERSRLSRLVSASPAAAPRSAVPPHRLLPARRRHGGVLLRELGRVQLLLCVGGVQAPLRARCGLHRLHRYVPHAVAHRRRTPLRRRMLAVRFCDPPSWKNNGRLRNRGVQRSPRIMGSPCSPRCSTSPSFLEGVIILQREECPLMRGYCLVYVFKHEID